MFDENLSVTMKKIGDKLFNAYNAAGGHAKLVAFSAFKHDAHGLSGSRDGVKVWWPETEKFLKEIGMPTEETVALLDDPHLPRTDYAALNDVDAIPYLEKNGREQYKAFLSKSLPRAFAVSPTGTWSWAEEGDDPASQVLANCQKKSKQPCKLYAVDDYVVWTGK